MHQFKIMFQAFYNRSGITGFISGLMGTILLQVRTILTDEQLLKQAAGLGVYMATLVSMLSALMLIIKLWDLTVRKLRKSKTI